MSGQTKLYQRAGSPLIAGHSKNERSAWVEWLLACIVSTLVLIGIHAVATLLDPTRPYLRSFSDFAEWLWVIAPGIATGVVASGLVVWYAHRSGWRRRAWVAAGVFGAVAGIAAMGIAAMALGWHTL